MSLESRLKKVDNALESGSHASMSQADPVITLIKLRAPVRFGDALQIQKSHAAELANDSEKTARLFLLQHTPVYTLGRRTGKAHLTCSEDDLSARTGAEVVSTDRGGSVTYHGPGQLMAYMLLNLKAWNLSVHRHLENLEEAALRAIAKFGLRGRREAGMTGVWIGEPEARKICAIGISAHRWITFHGLCLNIDLDLKPFDEIVPCGLQGKSVTSMAKELGRAIMISEAEDALAASFSEVYGARLERGMV